LGAFQKKNVCFVLVTSHGIQWVKIKFKKTQTRFSSLLKLEVMGFTKIQPKFSNPTFYTCPCSNKTHGLGLYFTNN